MRVQNSGTTGKREIRPEPESGAAIITLAIACCGFALAIVVAVAYAGF